MCLPFLNLFVWYDALLRGWCIAYVGDARLCVLLKGLYTKHQITLATNLLLSKLCFNRHSNILLHYFSSLWVEPVMDG
jgi:hypothetical protein